MVGQRIASKFTETLSANCAPHAECMVRFPKQHEGAAASSFTICAVRKVDPLRKADISIELKESPAEKMVIETMRRVEGMIVYSAYE